MNASTPATGPRVTLAEIGRPGQVLDVLAGGDVDPGTGALLSVGQLQAAMRAAATSRRTRQPSSRPGTGGAGPAAAVASGTAPAAMIPAPAPPIAARVAAGSMTVQPAGLPRDRPLFAVVGAHPGAGCSTVALLVAEAAARTGDRVHLVETTTASRSGLAATTSIEMGVDPSGRWRRGTREGITVDRRADDAAAPPPWPGLLPSGLLVLDLGSSGIDVALPATARVLLVCRASVPGFRAAEQALTQLGGSGRALAGVAVLGGRRWAGPVRASLGPRLRLLLSDGAVVGVPIDRRLEVMGLTSAALPRSVTAAAVGLLRLVRASGVPRDGVPRDGGVHRDRVHRDGVHGGDVEGEHAAMAAYVGGAPADSVVSEMSEMSTGSASGVRFYGSLATLLGEGER